MITGGRQTGRVNFCRFLRRVLYLDRGAFPPLLFLLPRRTECAIRACDMRSVAV